MQRPQTARRSSPRQAAAKRLLKTEAYDELKRRIVFGRLEPGSFLSERALSADLGMSKTPVRAALERLEHEGLVRVSPQQGIVVCEPAIHEIADLFEIRQALEIHVVRSIAGKLRKDQAAELRSHLQTQREAVERGDIQHSVELDLGFHLMLCRFLGNLEISRVMLQLRDKAFRVIMQVLDQNPARLPGNLREHSQIARAILGGDAAAAGRMMGLHLRFGRDYLLSRGRPT